MKIKNNLSQIILIPIFLLFIACGKKDVSNHGYEDEEEESTYETDVHIKQNQIDAMQIKLGKFQMLNLSTTVKSNGYLELPPQNKASVSPILGGRVKSINVLEGDFVRKGQVLARLEHPDFIDIQQNYLSAKSELEYLGEEYERKQNLQKSKISSRKELEQAKSNYFSKKAQVEGLRSKLILMNLKPSLVEQGQIESTVPILSPIKGFVRLVETNIGKFIAPEVEMFEIVDNDHIHIDLRVFEKDLHQIKKGQKVIFSLPNQPAQVYEGQIFAVGKAFENDQKAMKVHAEISNKEHHVLPGMYVDARIVTNTKKARSLPNDAIVSDGGLNYIFVLKEGGKQAHEGESIFRKIEVNLGASDIGYTEVIPTYKLPEHTQIVINGAFYLLAEMKKGEGGHGHHH